jgi:hypothetical protein
VHVVDGQGAKMDSGKRTGASKFCKHSGEGMPAIDLHVSVGADDNQALTLQATRKVNQ